MTKREAIRNHRRLWKWLAKNPAMRKGHWPEWEYNGGTIEEVEADCFLCELAGQNNFSDAAATCKRCIGDWASQSRYKTCNRSEQGLYCKWNSCENPTKRTELALKIRDVVSPV